jgi:hypothetical protein
MRYLFVLFLIIRFSAVFAQDDLPDYRSKKDVFLRIQDKAIRSDLAAFTMAGIDESMGKLPLQSIPVTAYTDKSISFGGNGIAVTVTAGVFLPTAHKLNYYGNYLVRIDNKPYVGYYGRVPAENIVSVLVILDGDTVSIPKEAYADIYDPPFTYVDAGGQTRSHDNVYLSADHTKIYIYLLNTAVPGGYEVTWVIADKKYARRVVDYGFLK